MGIEHIDLAARLGDDVVLVAAALEQRHLAEEIALLQHRLLVGGDLNHGLAAGDQIHRIAHDGNARKEHARIDQLGDLGDLAFIHGGEQRNAQPCSR